MQETEPVTMDAYAPRHDTSLSGRSFSLALDDGRDCLLELISGDALRWTVRGEAPLEAAYACARFEEGLYLLAWDAPEAGLSLALDTDAGLVTLVAFRRGTNPKRPSYLAASCVPGAVLREGAAENPRRHGYTAELVGKAVRWRYSPDFAIVHIYLSERYYRIKLLKRLGDADSPYEKAMAPYRDRTEPAFYLRIRPGIFLFGFVEDNMDRVTGPEISCAARVQLIDTARMYTVGRGCGGPAAPGAPALMGARGEFVSLPPEDFSPESAYTV